MFDEAIKINPKCDYIYSNKGTFFNYKNKGVALNKL